MSKKCFNLKVISNSTGSDNTAIKIYQNEDFLGDTVDENPLRTQGTQMRSLLWEDSTYVEQLFHHTCWACAPEPRSHMP